MRRRAHAAHLVVSMMQSLPDKAMPARHSVGDEYICWARMQAEAGQGLDEIVARKERERRAGGGTFFWGVGNAPAAIVNVLARAAMPVRAIFSVMKSRPKAVDVSPSRTVGCLAALPGREWRGAASSSTRAGH